jgi:hypothetical protein
MLITSWGQASKYAGALVHIIARMDSPVGVAYFYSILTKMK